MSLTALSGLTFKNVPGLRIVHEYLPGDLYRSMRGGSIELNRVAEISRLRRQFLSPALYPLYASSQDLVMSREVLVKLPSETYGLKGEFIERLSEKGHRIFSFRGEDNIPTFVKAALMAQAILLPEAALTGRKKPHEWSCLINSYVDEGGRSERAKDFGFHQDEKFTGKISVIYSMGATAILQLRKQNETKIEEFEIPSNTLIILSRAAHKSFEHRMLTIHSQNTHFSKSTVETVRRMSIVLGIHDKV